MGFSCLVLILVLVEEGLGVIIALANIALAVCLNPCFSGRGFRRLKENMIVAADEAVS